MSALMLMAMLHQATSGHPPCVPLQVPDVQGSYTIPYIQSERSMRVRIDFPSLPPNAVSAAISLRRAGGEASRQRAVTRAAPEARFNGLAAGEYSLTATATDAPGLEIWRGTYHRLGIGTVVAAIGDSLTEGYHGHGFKRPDLDLRAADFPPDAVSTDGRNFPQFAPTTAHHKPTVNCFQSWMTRLNNSLTAAWQRPVFIANEGWGGYTSGAYLAMMRGNRAGWCDRMRRLRPVVWLIHLGVNDERYQVPADTFAANLRSVVDLLRAEHGASPDAIYIARPSYDYAPGAEAVLREYITRIDALVAEQGLRPGPDFFAAFATDKGKWYGSDPVHPGPMGIERMADLWLRKLAPYPPAAAEVAAETPVVTVPAPAGVNPKGRTEP